MPIGYIVGKQYRINTEYDQWAKLDIFSKILRVAGQRGLSVFINYSHIGRNYTAEIKRHHRYKPDGDLFLISVALKHDSSPLLAMMAALNAAFEKQPDANDLYMRVLFLEGEAAELTLTLAKVRAREARAAAVLANLDKQLDGLFDVLALAWGYQTRAEMKLLISNPLIKIEHKSVPIRGVPVDVMNLSPADPDEDDDL